jgi:hypothetical protein
MTARRQRIAIEPYNLTFAQVAEAVFARSENWLRMNLANLAAELRFPMPDERVNLFNRGLIEEWVDQPYGRLEPKKRPRSEKLSEQARMLEAAASGR